MGVSSSCAVMLVGRSGAGKTTAAEIGSAVCGYKVVSAGSVMRDLIREAGLDDRDPIGRGIAALRIMELEGPDIVARRVLSEPQPDKLMLDGFRTPKEVEFLRQRRCSTVIWLEADAEVRHRRLQGRSQASPSTLLENDRLQEQMGLASLQAMADMTILNEDLTLEKFGDAVVRLFETADP